LALPYAEGERKVDILEGERFREAYTAANKQGSFVKTVKEARGYFGKEVGCRKWTEGSFDISAKKKRRETHLA